MFVRWLLKTQRKSISSLRITVSSVLWWSVLSLPFSSYLFHFIYQNIYLVYLNSKYEYYIFYLEPQPTRVYSTTSMKSSGKLFCPCLFSLFSLFLFTWISVMFTSILRVNIVSLTQDHSHLNTTAPLQWRALVSCSFLTFLVFIFFILITWIPISFTSILSINIMSFTQDHS